MNRLVGFVTSIGLVTFLGAATVARAGQAPGAIVRVASEAAVALPLLDRFEDEGQMLEVLSPAIPFSDEAALTLVYKDEESRLLRLTVNPREIATSRAAVDTFLGRIDPAFLSFVRSSIGDRLIRIKAHATALDRVEAALFFPSKRAQIATPAPSTITFTREQEFIPLAID